VSVERPIYLDNHATTPVDPRVLAAMLPYFTDVFGNAASAGHEFGSAAQDAVQHARARIAAALNAQADEIVFTSGATESDNLAIKGVAFQHPSGHLITVATEHKAVLDPCRMLAEHGYRVTVLPVDGEGRLALEDLERAFQPDTLLVSVMHANNEIGTVHDIAAIAASCRSRGVLCHTDATQTIGRLPFDVAALGVDLASFTAHKMYGPKGAGGLYVRRGCTLLPLFEGGGHERGLRSGTLNVPGIVGLAEALTIAVAEMPRDAAHTRGLRDRLWIALREAAPRARLTGVDPAVDPDHRLPNNLHVTLDGLEADRVSMALRDVACSTRSACTSGASGPSHVLEALGRPDDGDGTSLRFGLGRFTTDAEIARVTAGLQMAARA
jgi:cysteine desulfurase